MADTFRNAEAEVKIIVSGGTAERARRALGLDAEDGKRLTIYFWDKPRADGDGIRLPLAEGGAIIRLRRPAKGDKGDLTAKLRPCDPDALPDRWRENRDGKGWEFKIEEDWSGRNRVWAASLKVDGDFERPVDDDGHGRSRRPRLTPEQRDLLASAGVTDDDLEDLVALGPIRAIKWKPCRRDLIHPLIAEFWSVGDDLRFLELSLRTRHAEAPAAQELLERTMLERGLCPSSRQEPKTQTVLTALARDHLSRQALSGES
ncbi:hypothetical protein [Streptomyces griseocarneus]|uniref:hypothetical protein n=1 Tax=Streptomyces griseocarneus TaxID=51201 RepID=UPI00167E0988|nr:hypothetical protein [Streptomyces griseocarneus]MBZ6477129.1 hypothetical protein [Streptomyces griseocarneus]GHG53717.1 hypothetical protein GCM10018779_15890 [Streptomyces griseocarneus]